MEPSKNLWQQVFNTDPPKVRKEVMERDRIIFFLKESFITTWPNLKWSNYKLNKKDKEIIKLLAKNNYKKETHF